MIQKTFVASVLALLAIAGTASASIIADFTADYQNTTPKAGWSYLWTATGPIGAPANYSPLVPAALFSSPTNNAYDIAGSTFPAGGAGTYTIVEPGFMHPGNGTGQGTFEHFTIAAYTLSSAGIVSVVNLATSDGDPSSGDGVEFWVGTTKSGVNSGSIVGGFANGGSFSDALIPLGFMHAGDTVYVATGSKSDNNNDSTSIQFQISSVPEPTSIVLFGLGAVGLIAAVRRRKA